VGIGFCDVYVGPLMNLACITNECHAKGQGRWNP
jgi:hypothetical protein